MRIQSIAGAELEPIAARGMVAARRARNCLGEPAGERFA
jgi:hypothetical protein